MQDVRFPCLFLTATFTDRHTLQKPFLDYVSLCYSRLANVCSAYQVDPVSFNVVCCNYFVFLMVATERILSLHYTAPYTVVYRQPSVTRVMIHLPAVENRSCDFSECSAEGRKKRMMIYQRGTCH
jgi:hypothetical protein